MSPRLSALARSTFLLLGVCAALAPAGCAPDKAPPGLDELPAVVWRQYDTGSDDDLGKAIVALSNNISLLTPSTPYKLLITDLVAADIAPFGRTDVDITKAQGMLVVTDFGCTLDQVNQIQGAPNQMDLHPSSYSKYARTYKTSREDYLSHAAARVEWNTNLTSSYFTESLAGGQRWVAKTPLGGPAMFSRTWLLMPAKPEQGMSFPQDWQIEAYYERSPGRTVHMMGWWRQMAASSLTTDDSILQNIQLGGFVDWDKEVEKACASGKF